MKKVLAILAVLASMCASAYDVTNTVTIVSNIYYRIGEEHWITNNVKNTHANYFYTNNVYTVSNQTLLVSQTNINTSVTVDIGNVMLAKMSNEVDRANLIVSNASDFASAASVSAGDASFYANRAHASELQAQAVVGTVNTRRDQIIAEMNAKQDWFDQNYGKLITNEVYETHTYFPNLETNYIDGAGQEHKDLLVSLPKLALMSIGGTNFTIKTVVNSTETILTFDSIRLDDGEYHVHMKAPGNGRIWKHSTTASSDLYLEDAYYTGTSWVLNLYRQYNGGSYTVEATAPFNITSRVTTPRPGSAYLTVSLDPNGSFTQYQKVDSFAMVSDIGGVVDSKIEELKINEFKTSTGNAFNAMTNRFTEAESRIANLENKDYSNDRIVHYGSREYEHYRLVGHRADGTMPELNYYIADLYVDNLSYHGSPVEYNFIQDDFQGQNRGITVNKIWRNLNASHQMFIDYTYRKSASSTSTDRFGFPTSEGFISYDVLPHATSNPGYGYYMMSGSGTIVQFIEIYFVAEYVGKASVRGAMDYFISSDFNVYDASSNVIDRLVRMSQLNSFSNWVEQTFQRK